MRATLWMLTVVCVSWSAAWTLRLGAFNIQVFGEKKAENNFVMTYLAKILPRYDIVLIQEIRDSTDNSVHKLINQIKTQEGVGMSLEISKREGRSESKEQYGFLYRADKGISVTDVYDDSSQSWSELFERPPFIVRFCSQAAAVGDFTLMGLHSKPLGAVGELQALPQVYNTISKAWNTTNIIILGDLNADCNYVRKSAWKNIPIRHDSRFWWPITEGTDTTADSDCAYDRFIISGESLQAAVIKGTAKPFYYNKKYGLDKNQTLEISDHFPIELEMRRRKNAWEMTSQC